MADFILWGKIEQIAPAQFFVLITALRQGAESSAETVERLASTRAEAEALRDDLLRDCGAAISVRGDRVVDVETD